MNFLQMIQESSFDRGTRTTSRTRILPESSIPCRRHFLEDRGFRISPRRSFGDRAIFVIYTSVKIRDVRGPVIFSIFPREDFEPFARAIARGSGCAAIPKSAVTVRTRGFYLR